MEHATPGNCRHHAGWARPLLFRPDTQRAVLVKAFTAELLAARGVRPALRAAAT